MMLNKILNEISASEVKSSPFPHIVIDNLLDYQTMKELHEELSNIKLNDIAQLEIITDELGYNLETKNLINQIS